MKTTSLELSRKLYEAFPEWKDTDKIWWFLVDHFEACNNEFVLSDKRNLQDDDLWYPAYDTDFLLDKLPEYLGKTRNYAEFFRMGKHKEGYSACYMGIELIPDFDSTGDTPAEALGNLALALKEKGLL